jgi:hypothetical protein
MVQVQLDKVRHKQEQPPTAGDELAGDKREGPYIGNRFNGGTGVFRTFFVQPTWQGSEALFTQYLSYGGGAETDIAVFEGFADLVNRVILLSQLNDQIPRGRLARLGTRSLGGGYKEVGIRVSAKLVAQDTE